MSEKIEEKPWHNHEVMSLLYKSADIASDEAAAEYFRSVGYEVARRTITDARNALGIPSPSLMDIPTDVEQHQKKKPTAPSGLNPGIKIEGNAQVIVTDAMPPGDVDWDSQIREWGLDPQEWGVRGDTVKFSVWEQKSKDDEEPTKLWSWKGELYRKTEIVDNPDYEEELELVKYWKPSEPIFFKEGDRTLVVCLADWQIGSADGRGTKAIISRVLQITNELVEHIRGLKVLGYAVHRVHFQGLGDLFEGCFGHYANQQFTVELDRREQTRVVRRLLLNLLKTVAGLVPEISVGTVPGNHGEFRNDNGKVFTKWGDNDDVAVFEQLADICAESELLKNIKFTIPNQDLVQVFDFDGTIVGFIHAHQAQRNKHSGGLPPAQAKVLTWWEGQTFGGHPVGDADILVTGHYHHLSVIEHGSKTHIQCPAMDDGSIWFTNISGQASRPGTLVFLAGGGGYEALTILGS